jgi:hypothetical protein
MNLKVEDLNVKGMLLQDPPTTDGC